LHPDPSWTAGGPCTAASEGLHQAAARIARSRPDAVAVVSGSRTIRYGELNDRADIWAGVLAAKGIRPGDVVPILMPRSTELVTAILAVLKTGAAYALLESAWPASRLREMTGELGARLLVAADGTVGRPWLPVWSPHDPVSSVPGFRPVPARGSDPCCVFFTSGTTGLAKAVLSTHIATARLFQPGSFARFTPDTVIPLAAPVPWDAFSLELWSALLNGGTAVIVDEPYLSAQTLRTGVSLHGVDTAWLTSSLFNMIVDEDLGAFTGLRQVMTGGERLSAAHVRRFLRQHPAITLLNGYGPVESTVFATTHRITPADCERPGGIPIGRPVTGTRVYVMDGPRLCDVGETGEICIAGDGLALGYLNDPALTGAKFVTVRAGGRPVRVYRTGDLGIWGPDGLLQFGGRADRQLKIRGHRIEPTEIERQVERLLPSVSSCRVLARTDATGGRELVAFCVPAEPGNTLKGAMSELRTALVPPQRPAAVVSVRAFPVTARGKVDEQALLSMAPPPAGANPSAAPCPDGDPMVSLVTEIFGAVLGASTVPPDVPFTELGGTSLGAGRVCARLAGRLGRPVSLSGLYQNPTAAEFARWLRDGGPAACRAPAVPSGGKVPLTPMQLVYLARHLSAPSDRTGHCLLTWAIEGELDRAALESAIAAAHRRHEPLRAAYLADPRPVARLADIPAPRLEVLGSQPSAEAAARVLRSELAGELDLAGGQVWRTAVVPVRAAPVTVLGCVVHHIAFDGWSESVLAADIAAAYNRARGAGTPAAESPPSLAAAYTDYAGRVAHADMARQQDYLRKELADLPALRWPAAPAQHGPCAPGEVELPLGPDAVAGIDAQAAEAGVTRFVVLLSHCARSLAEVTGQRDLAVGVPVAQRSTPALERAVGCHINMLCVRLRGAAIGRGPSAIRETGRIAVRAFAAQDVPFSDVLRLARPPGAGRPPLFQTLFTLQDNAIPRLSLTGLRTAFLRQPYVQLPLELHTELWPGEDGGMRLVVSFRPEAVPEITAREFAERFTDRVHARTGARV
jgi:mycobactin peptide synthetase MbtE